LRVALAREEGVLKVRIPKRRGPPLVAPVVLDVGFTPKPQREEKKSPALVPAERARVLQFAAR